MISKRLDIEKKIYPLWISANPYAPAELTPTGIYEYLTDIFVRHKLKRIYDY